MKFELEIDLQPNQVQKLKRHLEDFCYNNFCGQPVLRQTNVSGALPLAEVRKKADKIGKEFKRKWEAKYVGFGDGSSIELWWRHQIEDAFGGNDR